MRYLLALALIGAAWLMMLSTRVEAAGDDKLRAPEATFVTEAISSATKEVKLGQLVAEKATTPEVKAFAQRMVVDFSRINSELHALAKQKNLMLASGMDPEHQNPMEKVSGMKGEDLEKAYMQAVVKDHMDDLAAYRRAAAEAKDPDVKAFADRTVPALQDHMRIGQNVSNGTATNYVFAMEANSDGLMEVQLSRAVAEKATTPDVKAFAQRMVTDHAKINNELHALAQQKSVTLPDEMDQEDQHAMQNIAGKQGLDLDKAYVQAMVRHHTDVLGAFQDAASDATDVDVKAFAARTVPVIEEHLRMALNLNKSLAGTDDARTAGQTEGGAQKDKDKEKDKD